MSLASSDGHGQAWLSLLRCPYCARSLEYRAVSTPHGRMLESGLLTCSCSVFPVVDGIPILQRSRVGVFEHTTGGTQVEGPTVAELVELIERGRTLDALLECLTIPAAPAWLEPFPWRVRTHRAVRRLARWRGRRQVLRDVVGPAPAIGVERVFSFFFRPGRLDPALGEYFRLRFGQPRHLAALALLATLKRDDKPVLDIGCGMGHFEHYLSERTDPARVLGLDMNFFQLWMARRWISPKAYFVCSNVEDGLPVASDACSAVVCSDAYHYVRDRQRLLEEVRRCAPGRPVYLTRVGNRVVIPNEGRESSVQEYLDEIGEPDVRVFGETALLKAYLRRSNPLTAPRVDARDLVDTKWLSFVWNAPHATDPPWTRNEWPHAVGVLGLNPVYKQRPAPGGDLQLTFEFPLPWFAYENHEMLSYHPRSSTVSRAQLDRLDARLTDPDVISLVESFVVIGLPRGFRRHANGSDR